jgi:hypothetical protein
MAEMSSLFGVRSSLPDTAAPAVTYLLVQRPLHRILAFTGRSIDDVVNNPVAKNEIMGYFRLYKQIQRASEVTELERQWRP